MTPDRLREILLARGGRVTLDELRKCDSFKSEDELTESIEYLVDMHRAVGHGDSVQARTGFGRLIPPTTSHIRADGQNPQGVLGRLSSVSARAAAAKIKKREKSIPLIVEALRRGLPEKEAMRLGGFRSGIKQVSIAYRDKLMDAKREGLALRSATA